MIRDIATLAIRGAIALALLAAAADYAFADHVEVRCQPVVIKDVRCSPAGLRYNRAPYRCVAA